ncbi:MAG TPA: hypothetical protein VKR59_18650 [Terriglobales bacterium]|nr:hypothetical protein [Terriglobales bacterium]
MLFLLITLLVTAAIPGQARILKRDKDASPYGEGLIVNVPLPEAEVATVVEDVAANSIIRGTKEYNKDEYIGGAEAASSSTLFPVWKDGGKVFFKVRKEAIDPRNFKDGGDVGTLAVRYVVQPQGDKNTILRINALFGEDFRRTVHQSNGSVESSEYQDIHDRLDAIELMKKENAEAEQARQEQLAKKKSGVSGNNNDSSSSSSGSGSSSSRSDLADMKSGDVNSSEPPKNDPPKAAPSGPPAIATVADAASVTEHDRDDQDGNAKGAAVPELLSTPTPSSLPQASVPQTSLPTSAVPELSGESLEQHVAELRRQVERLVKKPGAPLKSAPFHTASTVRSLAPGTEVLVVISTTYWYGIETHEGEHGWLRRDEVEQIP